MNVSMGLPPGDLTPRLRRTCAERALISIPGKVARVEGEGEARGVAGIEEVFLRAGRGDEVVFPSNNVEKCGNVIAVADDRGEAVRRAGRALSLLLLRLEPRVERTTSHLFRESGNDAFAGIDPAFEASLAALPAVRGDPSRLRSEGPIPVLPLRGPALSSARDWYGRSLQDAVQSALRLGGGVLVASSDGAPAVGSVFWRALARGGVQGAVYLLDSVREATRTGSIREMLGAI